MKRIPLSGKYGKGKFTLIDDEDFRKVNKYKWHCDRSRAVIRTIFLGLYDTTKSKHGANQIRKTIWLHRFILNAQKGIEVDHKDFNKLNNQRSNLRLATHQQNNMNKKLQKNNTSSYKGVSYKKTRSHLNTPYVAYIKINKKYIHLGCFKTAIEAAKTYNKAAKQYHKEFAYLNPL